MAEGESITTNVSEKKIDLFLIAILILGIAVLIVEIYFASKVKYLDYDPAIYANLAENIINGRGFVLDTVTQFIVPLNSVTHQEEWGLPMMGIIIAPFILLFGKTAFAVKLPSILAASIFFPILTYYLGKEFFDRRIGFLAGISILFYPSIHITSLFGQRDTLFALFLLGGIYFFWKGMNENNAKFYYLMGLFLGISYLIRQTTLIVIPTLILAYYLIKKEINLKLAKGMLLGVLVILPWLIRNYMIFGDPFFSVNRYVVWLAEWFSPFDSVAYRVFWFTEKPSFRWLISSVQFPKPLYSLISAKIINGFLAQFYYLLPLTVLAFVGSIATSYKKLRKTLLITAIATPIVLLFVIAYLQIFIAPSLNTLSLMPIPFVLYYFAILIVSNFILAKENPRNRVFALIWTVLVVFHGVYAFPGTRFLFTLIPFFFIFSWAGVNRLLELIAEKYQQFKPAHIEKILVIGVFIFILINAQLTFGGLFDKNKQLPYEDDVRSDEKIKMAELISNVTEKNAVVMICDSPIFHFYTGRKTVDVPSDTLENTLAVILAYNVSYISFLGCKKRVVHPDVYDAFFRNTTLPQEYSRALIRINAKIPENEQGQFATIEPEIVAWMNS